MITLPAIDVTTILRTHRVKEATIDAIVAELVAKTNTSFVLNFGKYNGKSMAELYADPKGRSYLQWLAKELDSETEKFQDVKEALKNYV